jgi:hypothetical protein
MSIGKLPTIKTSKSPTMADYKSGAAVSRDVKLKAMAGGGNVTVPPGRQPTSPIWKSVPPALPSGASRQSVSPPISKASAPLVAVSPFAAGGNVIRGPAAEREMARMEREAKAEKEARAAGNQRLPKKG